MVRFRSLLCPQPTVSVSHKSKYIRKGVTTQGHQKHADSKALRRPNPHHTDGFTGALDSSQNVLMFWVTT